MKTYLIFFIIFISSTHLGWAGPEKQDSSAPLPPSVKPVTPANPAGPAKPHPKMAVAPADENFDQQPEASPGWPENYPSLSREEYEATLEAVDPSWHQQNSNQEEVLEKPEPYLAEPDGGAVTEEEFSNKSSDQQVPTSSASPHANPSAPLSFEDLLSQHEGRDFEYKGLTYIWQNGVPYEKKADGSLLEVELPENLVKVEADGNQWLSQDASGTVYINIAPKIWATINFANNSDMVEKESEPVLDIFGESLNSPALINYRLIIAGHTSKTGSAEYNLKLSRRRALSVSRYLIEQHHIKPERLILHGHGFENPLTDDETEEGLALNRRVEFILLEPAPHK